MAGSPIALVDDVATMLDDAAVFPRVFTRKAAGAPGGEPALNARHVSGARSKRELAPVRALAKGSLVNKAILAPSA